MIDKFEQCYERITGNGWLTKNEASALWNAAAQTEGNIIEIGSHRGRSAMLLVQLALLQNRMLHCVEPWDGTFDTDTTGEEIRREFLSNMEGLSLIDELEGILNHLVVHRCRVEVWQPVPAGLVYCDGDHSYTGTVSQVRKALECKPSIIAVHDVSGSKGGKIVRDAATGVLNHWAEIEGTLAIWKVSH